MIISFELIVGALFLAGPFGLLITDYQVVTNLIYKFIGPFIKPEANASGLVVLVSVLFLYVTIVVIGHAVVNLF